MNAIDCRDVTVAFRRVPAVECLTFCVAPGEHVALFGGAGAGKSTVLGALAGVLPIDDGSASVLGRAPGASRGDLAHVCPPQDGGTGVTVAAAISRALSARRLPGAQRAARVADAMELFGLGGAEDRPVRDLSRGVRIATMLACALAPRPAVLLLDNVLGELPPPLIERLFRHLADRRSLDGLAVVHGTTASAEAERADRVVVLDAGRCLADASPGQLIAEYASDTVIVEAEDPKAIRRTLRGLFDVEISVSERELRFTSRDGMSTAARLFRHPEGGLHAVCVRRGDLWDVLARLRVREA